MKTKSTQKKQWLSPAIQTLRIKEDTFGGTVPGVEDPLNNPTQSS